MQIQLVPALFCHNYIDVALTFRKSELGVMNVSRNVLPNLHPKSFTLVELHNTTFTVNQEATFLANP